MEPYDILDLHLASLFPRYRRPCGAACHTQLRISELSSTHAMYNTLIQVQHHQTASTIEISCAITLPMTPCPVKTGKIFCYYIRTAQVAYHLLKLAVFVTCASCVVPRGWAVFYQALPSSVVAWHAHDLRGLLQSCYRVIRIRPRLANNPALYAFDVRNTAYGYTRIQRRCCIWIDAQRPGDDAAHRAGRFDSAGGVTVSMCK